MQRIASPELLTNNETFHRLLTEGIPVSKRVNGDDRGDRVWLIDFKNPGNNDFVVANQFTIIENGNNKRPDRSEEHTSELQSLMRKSYAVFCLKKKKHTNIITPTTIHPQAT